MVATQPEARDGWAAVLALSGAAALTYEAVWFRRLSLVIGASAPAAAATVAAFMLGLAAGGLAAGRIRDARRGYVALELFAAGWAVAMPATILLADGGWRQWIGPLLLVPPATALGATWPLVARGLDPRAGAGAYAANTAGAVLGVLASTFVAIPVVGVRGTELLGAGLGAAAAALGARLGWRPRGADPERPPPSLWWLAAAVAGFTSLGLEVAWTRLVAVGLGATVQAMGWVLGTFLAMSALGAAIGRSTPRDPATGVWGGLAAVAALAVVGSASWGLLPYGIAAGWAVGGPDGVLLASATAAGIAMGGAPIASGLAFACAARAVGGGGSGRLYAINAFGSAVGAASASSLVAGFGLRGAVAGLALLAAAASSIGWRRWWPLALTAALVAATPAWDARLFAVGVYLRISDFADPSPAAIRAFADDGWELVSYEHGRTGAVAVGRSTRTGNTWLSINGKVDASTGADMPTQLLSATVPIRVARRPVRDVLVVGLASGVTAGAALAEPDVRSLTVIELEPAVVRASAAFDAVSGRPLADPRTTLVVDDARGWLTGADRAFDVIVSEPSNPWITGVSSLFTREYWALLRAHLRQGGVVCQWIQLYGMGTDEFRGLVRTFLGVFPDSRLFVSIDGSDVLLVGGDGGQRDGAGPIPHTLDAAQLRQLAGDGWINTDDRPWVEWSAPRWLHYDTAPANAELIRVIAAQPTGTPPAPDHTTR